ncbi:MAG: hypothetical protein ABI297_06275, partial [Ginsengibacter sp.]
MRTIQLYFQERRQFYNFQIKIKFSKFFLILVCLFGSLLFQINTAIAQVTPCKGCTASDVNVLSVALVGTDHNPLPVTCSGSTQITGVLKITIDQNATTRYGYRVSGDILVDGQYVSMFSYCNSSDFSGVSVIYIDASPINWTCGTKLQLRNLFVGWGINGNTPNKNACYLYPTSDACDLLAPHCAQFPINGEPPIVIITPLNANFSFAGSCPSSQVAQTYSFDTTATNGGTLPYPSNAFSWTIVNKITSVLVGTMTGAKPTFNFSPYGSGTYTVTLTVTDDNPTAVSAISKDITVTSCCPQPNAGTNGTLTVCSGTTPTSTQLFAALGGSPSSGGVWSGPVNGVYTYTLTAAAPCSNTATSTVTVTEAAKPNAGTSGSLSICTGSTVTETQLNAVIGTHDAGSWSPALAGAGTYTYTVAATSPCTVAATATVTVTEQAKPNAGTSGSLSICTGSIVTETQLNAVIGTHDAGIWSPALAGAGTYTFTVKATAPCTADATSTVTVTEKTQPNAGTSGSLEICTGSIVTETQLNAVIGTHDAGSWSPTLAGAGTYTFTVKATAPCTTDATSTVTVTEKTQPNAGTSGSLEICTGSIVTETQLNTVIGTHDAGIWSPALAGAGTYTFTVKATAPCTADATATVTVKEAAKPNAGTNGTLTVCSGTTPTSTQLFAALGGSATGGGEWSGPVSGVYTYTVTATSPCTVAATATVTVTEQRTAIPTLSIVQSTCSVSTATITVTSSTSGLLFSFDDGVYAAYRSGGYTTSTTGNHTVSAKNTTGCISGDATTTVNPAPPCGGPIFTYTQGFYHGKGKGCTPNNGSMSALQVMQLSLQHMAGGTLYLGKIGASFTATYAQASSLQSILPGGGKPTKLGGNYNVTTNYPPLKNGRINNVFLSQTITLALNINIPGNGLGAFVL